MELAECAGSLRARDLNRARARERVAKGREHEQNCDQEHEASDYIGLGGHGGLPLPQARIFRSAAAAIENGGTTSASSADRTEPVPPPRKNRRCARRSEPTFRTLLPNKATLCAKSFLSFAAFSNIRAISPYRNAVCDV